MAPIQTRNRGLARTGPTHPTNPLAVRPMFCPAPARRVTIYGGPWLFDQTDQVWHPSRGVFPRVAGLLPRQLIYSRGTALCSSSERLHHCQPLTGGRPCTRLWLRASPRRTSSGKAGTAATAHSCQDESLSSCHPLIITICAMVSPSKTARPINISQVMSPTA